jgi:hypothetical protein
MTRVSWEDTDKFYAEGIEKGVLYPQFSPGVPWTGLISVTEGADSTPSALYIDGQKVRDHIVPTVFSGTIVAYTYPDEFEPCIGVASGMASQPRKDFGLAYRDNRSIHLIYNAQAAPSSDQYQTLGGDISPVNFSWDISTTPVDVPFARPTARLVISLDYADPAAIADLEDIIYGNDISDPVLPDPATVIDIFESHTTLRITDNGDGTWTADGPDTVITMLDSETFQIDWPSAVYMASDSSEYRIFSL